MLQRVKTHISVEKFSSHKTEIFVEERGTLLCCVSKLSGSEKFMYKKGGEYHNFPSQFLSHSTEQLVEERGTLLCCVSESFW